MNDPMKGLSEIRTSRGLPPVEKWNPPYCGELDIRIARNGLWYYLGTPIGRPELVRLFSTILWREGDDYFLVTPVEKVKIQVDDAPFLAIDFDKSEGARGTEFRFTTQTGDEMVAGTNHPIEVKFAKDGEPSPYILVRRNLWALIDRKSYYRLVEECEVEGEMFGLRSQNIFFPIIKASALEV